MSSLNAPSDLLRDYAAQIHVLEQRMETTSPSWFRSDGFVDDMTRWSRLADDVGSFWGFAEDYLNELGVRERLRVWASEFDLELGRMAIPMIDEMDQRFFANSEGGRPGQSLSSKELQLEAWWRRRVPRDQELSDAIERNYWNA